MLNQAVICGALEIVCDTITSVKKSGNQEANLGKSVNWNKWAIRHDYYSVFNKDKMRIEVLAVTTTVKYSTGRDFVSL